MLSLYSHSYTINHKGNRPFIDACHLPTSQLYTLDQGAINLMYLITYNHWQKES